MIDARASVEVFDEIDSTNSEARRRADGIPFFQFALKFYSADRIGKQRDRPPPGSVDLWSEYERWKRENPDALERALSGGLIGSPETIRNRLHKYAGSHVDQIILLDAMYAGERAFDDFIKSHPEGRLGRPDEIAAAVVFVASPVASWINATDIAVDGGQRRPSID